VAVEMAKTALPNVAIEVLECTTAAAGQGLVTLAAARAAASGKNLNEVIEIVEKSGCVGGHIAHFKVSGESNWGMSKEALRSIEEANNRGISISYDQYPYNRGMSDLKTALPPWAREGSNEEILERIKKPEIQKQIIKDFEEQKEGWESWVRNNGFHNIYIALANNEKWKDTAGKSISEITKMKDLSDDYVTFFQILIDRKTIKVEDKNGSKNKRVS